MKSGDDNDQFREMMRMTISLRMITTMTMSYGRRNVEREVEIMNSLKSGMLLQLYDAYDNGRNEMCLVTE
jgi:hypothetical protein